MAPPHIQARVFYGLRTDIRGNAHYVNDSEVIYPAGGVLILHNHEQKHQRYIRLPDKHKLIDSVGISPNCQYIALNERADQNSSKPTISIYDLHTLKRKKGLTTPSDGTTSKEFVDVQFTCDSKYLVAITGDPDWMLYYYNWENGKVESQTKAQNPNGTGTVTQVTCNPSDPALVVITGPYTFKLMNVSETVWRQWGWTKAENIIITSCLWVTPDRVMFGTKTGMLMVVENGELRTNCIYRAFEVTEMCMKKLALDVEAEVKPEAEQTKEVKPEPSQEIISVEESEKYEVRCLTAFPKGFAYSCMNGMVHMFEKESPHDWIKRNVFKVMDEEFRISEDKSVDLNVVQFISVNPSQDSLLITTLKSQLYSVKLFEQHISQVPEIPFKELGHMLHHGCINCLTICSWKPIFMTSGKYDSSIRIWNYETEDLELFKFYHEDIHSLALHPTGLFVIIGFLDKLRYMVIQIDDLQQMREFPIRMCKLCCFSNNGHLFAAANGAVIQVFSAVSFINVFNLKGHNETISSLSWTAIDDRLVSCGSEGAVYEWCMTTARRVGEVIVKKNQFTDCAVRSDGKSIYVIGVDGELKEISKNDIIRNLKILGCKLDNMVLARSDLMIFVTGGLGNVAAIQFPLLDKAVFAEFHMHNRNITGLALSYDDQTLITVAEDATMCIWKLTNIEGKVIAMEKDFAYCREILIDKEDLQEKITTITVLSTRITEIETEHAYQMRQMKAANADFLHQVHKGYCSAIEELKERNEQLEADHSQEMNTVNDEIAQTKLNYEKAQESIETEFNAKLIGEYTKYQALEDKNAAMRSDYEEQLENLAQSKRLALRDLSDMYEAQLREKMNIIAELEQKNKLEAKEHEYIKSSIENDADREIVELKMNYESQLKEEKDDNIRLKGETGILKKKMISAQKDIEEYKHQINLMHAEHKQYQSIIQNLEKDITDLKKDISERDATIEARESRISELKLKTQELEKYKFVLNFKINELKNQIAPKEKKIRELDLQIQDMENEENRLLQCQHAMGIEPKEYELEDKKCRVKYLEGSLEKLIKKKIRIEFKLVVMNEKLSAANTEIEQELERYTSLKNILKKIQVDLFRLSPIIKDPAKLKSAVRGVLKQKYMSGVDFTDEKAIEEEVVLEFTRQRDHLEKRIAGLVQQLQGTATSSRGEVIKIMEENSTLLAEINDLRNELRDTTAQCTEMKALLGLSTKRKTPKQARILLQKACGDHDKISEDFHIQLAESNIVIQQLREENQRILLKLQCQQSTRSVAIQLNPEDVQEEI